MTSQHTIAALMLTSLAGVGMYVFVHPEPPRAQLFAAILVDVSPTSTEATRCLDVERVATRILSRTDRDVHLTLLATGDRSTGDQPQQLGSVSVARGTRLMEGTAAQGARMSAAIEQVRKLCAGAPKRNESPIHAGLVASLALLRQQKCGGHVACELWARTDGLEESDAITIAALRPRSKATRVLVPRLDNTDVDVTLCGLSDRTVSKKSRQPGFEQVSAAYRADFLTPQRVRTVPQCEAFIDSVGSPTS